MKKKSSFQGAHGGTRTGAGRPKGTSTKILERQSRADQVLSALGGDEAWKWAITEAKRKRDYRCVADILKYWTDRAQGKAPQAIKLDVEDGVQFSIGTIAEEAMAETNVGGGNAAN